jgi:hypothetical protein
VCVTSCAFHTAGFVDQPGDGGTPGDDATPVDAGTDAMPPDPPGVARAYPAPKDTIILDGVLTEWDAARWYGFDYTTAGLAESITGYTASFVVGFAAFYDADNLWLAFQVSDDRIIYDSPTMSDDDAVGVYLDAAGDRSGPHGPDDYALLATAQIAFGECQQAAGTPALFIECGAARAMTSYTIELRIPLGGSDGVLPPPVAGSTVGFNVQILDDDGINNPGNGSANDHENDATAWWFHDTSTCPTCCGVAAPNSWCDTSVFGRLVFTP